MAWHNFMAWKVLRFYEILFKILWCVVKTTETPLKWPILQWFCEVNPPQRCRKFSKLVRRGRNIVLCRRATFAGEGTFSCLVFHPWLVLYYQISLLSVILTYLIKRKEFSKGKMLFRISKLWTHSWFPGFATQSQLPIDLEDAPFSWLIECISMLTTENPVKEHVSVIKKWKREQWCSIGTWIKLVSHF